MMRAMSQQIPQSRYGNGNGVLLTGNGLSMDSLEKDKLLSLLAEAGFIVLRGFTADLGSFSGLVQRTSLRVSLDPARQFHGGKVAQKVDAGFDAVGLHCENGNNPFLPHLCWFFCEKAAKEGSQTTVCDGFSVWDALSASTRERFLAQPIQYSRNVEAAKWKTFVFHSLQGRKPLEQIEFSDLAAIYQGHQGASAELKPDGSIHYVYQVPAVHRTQFSERLAFANSILGPSYNYEKPKITFADGSPIPEQMLAEIADVTERCTENVEWQDGEVVLIDNTRVMHGRRAIKDPQRTIYNALSFLR
jgi:alpha-ketoglutarate-dependent taurine dioxygenase